MDKLRKRGAGDSGGAEGATFGQVLRLAIKDEFGTGRRFARALGNVESRVTQLKKDTYPLTAETLAGVLQTFTSRLWQERLREQWLADQAPLPEVVIDPDDPEPVLAQIAALDAGGRPGSALDVAKRLASASQDPSLWMRAMSEVVQILLRLDRRSEALRAVQRIQERARELGSVEYETLGAWQHLTVLRSLHASPDSLRAAHERAWAALGCWQPVGAEAKGRKLERLVDLERDHALTLLEAMEQAPLDQSPLLKALETLHVAAERRDHLPTRATCLLVVSRVQTVLGRPFEAEETLDALEQMGSPLADARAKLTIQRARICQLRGLGEETIRFLEETIDVSRRAGNMHHARVAEEWLCNLLVATLRG